MSKTKKKNPLYVNLDLELDLLEVITQEYFTVKQTGMSQRVINHWDNEGVLPKNSRVEGKWRRFTFVDYMWLKFVEELRSLGTPLPIIRNVREAIFSPLKGPIINGVIAGNPEILNHISDDKYKAEIIKLFTNKKFQDNLDFSVFHLMLLDTIINRDMSSMVIFKDGSWMNWSEKNIVDYSPDEIKKKRLESHVSVCFFNLIREFIGTEIAIPLIKNLKLLSENEVKILEIINSGEYESVKINFINKKIKSVEMVKDQDVKRKVVDVLTESDYQDIIIKSHKGMVTKIQNTLKVKFD